MQFTIQNGISGTIPSAVLYNPHVRIQLSARVLEMYVLVQSLFTYL
jgi:hypothetical protein